MRPCKTPGCPGDLTGLDRRRKFCPVCVGSREKKTDAAVKHALRLIKKDREKPKPPEKVPLEEMRRRKEILARYTRI